MEKLIGSANYQSQSFICHTPSVLLALLGGTQAVRVRLRSSLTNFVLFFSGYGDQFSR